jgi:uncharacterized RDD family membrane protein YckC
MSSISIAPTYSGVNLAERPSRRRRAGALLIDGFIYQVTSTISLIVVGLHLLLIGRDLELNRFGESAAGSIFDLAVSLFLALTYFVVFEAIYGATPGKWLLGMHVVKSDGRRCDTQAAAVRALCLFFIDGLLLGMVAYLSMQPPLYQRIGDRIAKTVVVNRCASPTASPFWRFLLATAIYMTIANLAILIFLLICTR